MDDKTCAAPVRGQVGAHVARLVREHGLVPWLAVVRVGKDPASAVCARNKGVQTARSGMNSHEHKQPAGRCEQGLPAVVATLNADPAGHCILTQLPQPGHLIAQLIINAMDPAQDVDGFHTANVRLLGTGRSRWCHALRWAAG